MYIPEGDKHVILFFALKHISCPKSIALLLIHYLLLKCVPLCFLLCSCFPAPTNTPSAFTRHHQNLAFLSKEKKNLFSLKIVLKELKKIIHQLQMFLSEIKIAVFMIFLRNRKPGETFRSWKCCAVTLFYNYNRLIHTWHFKNFKWSQFSFSNCSLKEQLAVIKKLKEFLKE